MDPQRRRSAAEGRVIGRPRGHRQIVSREDNRLSRVTEIAEDAQDKVLRRHVDSGERLVQKKDLGVLQKRPGDEHALLLTAGEGADLDGGEGTHPDLRERGQGIVTIDFRERAEAIHPQRPAHQGHVEHADGKSPVDLGTLRNVGHPSARPMNRLPCSCTVPCVGSWMPSSVLAGCSCPRHSAPRATSSDRDRRRG